MKMITFILLVMGFMSSASAQSEPCQRDAEVGAMRAVNTKKRHCESISVEDTRLVRHLRKMHRKNQPGYLYHVDTRSSCGSMTYSVRVNTIEGALTEQCVVAGAIRIDRSRR